MHLTDTNIIKNDIEKWIEEFLSISSPVFNNLPPCPYAKRAWRDKKVLVLSETINKYKIKVALDTLDVVIYAFDPDKITPDELYDIANDINQSDQEMVALDDHPLVEEKVEGQILNQGKYALLFIQNRNKLTEARKSLRDLGYYNFWTSDYLKEVLSM